MTPDPATTPSPEMSEALRQLRFCAFCPNPCRSGLPLDGTARAESTMPSAMAFLCLAVTDGRVVLSEEVRDQLARTDTIELAQRECPYGFDIAAALRAAVAELPQ